MKKSILFFSVFVLFNLIVAQRNAIAQGELNTNQTLEELTKKITSGSASSEEYCERGKIYREKQQSELALSDFNAAIKMDKSSTCALNQRGLLYATQQEMDKALKDFESAIKADVSYIEAYSNLANLHLSQNDDDAAFKVMDRMMKTQSKNPEAFTARADAYLYVGRLQEAVDDLNSAVELSGDDPEYLIKRARFKDDVLLDELGAIEDCDLAIEGNPQVAEYYYQRSRPLYDLADYVSVLENCEQALKLDPKHVNALIMKANVTDIYKLHTEAAKLYEEAIAIDPNGYDGYKQLSISEFAQGKKKKALSTLEAYMNLGNFHPDITELHGKVAADLKQFDVSIKDFSALVDKYPENPVYYFLRGIAKDSIKDHEAACDDIVIADKMGLREAHQYLRDHCKSRLSAKVIQLEDMLDEAFKLERAGKDQEALLIYDDLIKLAPDSSIYYYNRGKTKRRLNDHEGAIEDYLKAIDMDDDHVEYIVSLAVSYSYLDRVDDAVKEYKRAIKIEPRYAMSYYNLGGIYAKDKKYKKAIELFETSLIYSPKYTLAMMGLGDCYLEMNELDAACKWYTKAEAAGETRAFGKRVRTCK
jgi:tetratricopeptide (TPR) repeat protein